MLCLDPSSVCDVCADEYGIHNLPRSIPCGHILCQRCADTICEKTSPRLHPACPFCREHFTQQDIRILRVDYSSPRPTSPRQSTSNSQHQQQQQQLAALVDDDTILWELKRREDDPHTEQDRHRAEARKLEDRVAKVAAKKCSVEEVSTLYRDLQDWLSTDSHKTQSISLQLSAALLRAILMNHMAHSEAVKVAKGVEHSLRERVEDLEITRQKLEGEIRKQKTQVAIKTQECQQLRTELGKSYKSNSASTTPTPSTPISGTATHTMSAPATPIAPNGNYGRQSFAIFHPTGQPPHPPATPTPGSSSRHALSPHSQHTRTASLSARPTTPTPSVAPSSRSIRSMTPGPNMAYGQHGSRTMTPAPPLPRSMTPAVPIPSSHSRPLVPPKPRNLSSPPSPPSTYGTLGQFAVRGVVDDREKEYGGYKEKEKDVKESRKERRHERWIPSPEPTTLMSSGRTSRMGSLLRGLSS